jgi:hypothetical protein
LWPPGPGEEETHAAARGKEGIMESKGIIERLRRTALLTLALAGCGATHAASLAIFEERIINPAAGFPGCNAGVCAEGQNPFAPGAVQFNQQWNTGSDVFFMDGAAQTTGSILTGPPGASARMRTNISGGADATVYYEFEFTCPGSVDSCAVALGIGVPVHVIGFGSVDVRPDPAADDGSSLLGEAILDISQGGVPILSGSVIAECLYLRGECDTSSVPHSFAFTSSATFEAVPLQTYTVAITTLANVLPNANQSGSRGAGEVIATVDPVFYIDPEFRINGVLATDLFRLEFSPNVSQVPLPTTALLFATAMAALGWRRRKR